jgi:hypothetical protein
MYFKGSTQLEQKFPFLAFLSWLAVTGLDLFTLHCLCSSTIRVQYVAPTTSFEDEDRRNFRNIATFIWTKDAQSSKPSTCKRLNAMRRESFNVNMFT